jgi:hypothetical protein
MVRSLASWSPSPPSVRGAVALGFVACALVCWRPGGARGAEVQVRIQETPLAAQFAQQAGVDIPTLQADVQRELEALFQTYRVADYLRSFGDAHSFASRGLGVDYASNFKAVMFGVAGNLSLNVERGYLPRDTRTQPPAGGVSTNATIMTGLNLDYFSLAPITLFGNYFSRAGTVDEFAADLSNWGVHAQLKLWGAREERLLNALLRWGGLDVTAGLEHAHLRLTLARDFRRDIPVGSSANGYTSSVAVDSMGRFNLDMRTLALPLEITTNVRLLYLLSLYAGVGFDWQLAGGNDLSVDLDGTMVGNATSSDGQHTTVELGTATVDAGESAGPSKGRLRWLAGLQVNVLVIKVFAQLNLAAQDPVLASVALGARVAY